MDNFTGDTKEPIKSISANVEKKLIAAILPKIPLWLKGRHLTMMSIPLSIGITATGFYAQFDFRWLWVSCILIVLHWFSDSLDGAIGKLRKEGVPRWGFYMDHFMDYVFLTCIIIGYSFLFSGFNKELMLLIIPVSTGFMINSFLQFGATQKFEIAFFGVGPTDLRIFCIILNILIINLGTNFIEAGLLYVFILLILILIITVYNTQKKIKAIDDLFPE